MAIYRTALPQLHKGIFVCYTGMETDLIVKRGVDLPGFASYPLLETKEGQETLRAYYAQLMDMAKETGVGVLRKNYPHFSVIGGCSGTDMRHLRKMAEQV